MADEQDIETGERTHRRRVESGRGALPPSGEEQRDRGGERRGGGGALERQHYMLVMSSRRTKIRKRNPHRRD